MKFRTEQEAFWAGEFGNDYIERNRSADYLSANLAFFSNALKATQKLKSCIEFGANVGMNLRALQLLLPEISLRGIEINAEAASHLRELVGAANTFETSILDFEPQETSDLSLIKGVLIHVNPDQLQNIYDRLYMCSHRYILVCEYYNPTPVAIGYRGHQDRLFKRDFAGELLDKYSDLILRDYGFSYHRDPKFAQDDITWFLLEKV